MMDEKQRMTQQQLEALSDSVTDQHRLMVYGRYAKCSCGVEFSFSLADRQHRRHRDERFASALGIPTMTLPVGGAPTPILRHT